jgi:hypothetical protein
VIGPSTIDIVVAWWLSSWWQASMRIFAVICTLIAALVTCGCDPGGLRRMQLQLRNPPADNSTISVDSPDTKEALQILDSVFTRNGFKLTEDYPDQQEHDYMRLYSKQISTRSDDGHIYTRTISCHVRLTSTGIFVTFGEPGYLEGYSLPANDVYKDVRSTFIKRYGKKFVKSHMLGSF